MVMRYDPCVDPDAVQWLRLSEDARIEAVLEWHAREPPSGNPRLHAVAHVVVENILAEGELAVATTKLQELRQKREMRKPGGITEEAQFLKEAEEAAATGEGRPQVGDLVGM